ncbi:larval cuticle protein A3A-like [Bradysia coprophila]|uniref:larval cuticle protein A3A-like n=1 Tax=Bradysia coprophila TaxID=38358 RepID=UPI00187D8A8D|nr:larval cuticle protein A3A-like [Bradysia coprophila]
MIVKVVILMCFVFGSHAKPISVHEGVHYATAPAYSYASAPLQTYAVPKVVAPVVSAPIVSPVYHTPVYKHIEPEPYDPNPEYSYSYGVNDPHTGDSKHAEESLYNGVVRGSYSLAEPDGTIRKVTYTADKVNGFNAVVEKIGTPKHITPLKYVAAAPVYQAPIAKYVSPVAPVYHAPIAKYVAPATVYHAPVAKYVAPAAVYHAPVAKYVAPAAYHAPVYASYHGYH